MQIRFMLLGCMLTACILSLSCGAATDPAHPAPDTVLPTEEASPITAGLPSLNALPDPDRELSMSGPGWFDCIPDMGLAAHGFNPLHLGGTLPLGAVGETAFACYGVYGFDGDNGPTSARITATDIVGDYYVGFSDYIADKWVFSGPFTDSATAEIPNPNNYTSPTAFTSKNGHCFFAVIVPDGGSLTLTRVELGVHGGLLGPAAPSINSVSSNLNGIAFIWGTSLNAHDPDFAGYILERAPQFHGDFTRLTAQPIAETHYVDYFAQVDTPYRYRLTAADVSGNIGNSNSVNCSIDPTGQMNPVPVVNVPQGPLYGAQAVTFDLSASFDPEGDTIDNYQISVWSMATLYDGPNPLTTVLMEPGCYIYSVTATVTADLRSGTAFGFLKIYPAWNDTLELISPSPASSSRGFWISSGRHPVTGRLVHAITDPYSEQLMLLAERANGDLDYEPLWFANSANVPQAPVVYNDELLFLVENALNLQIVTYDGTRAQNIYGTAKYEQSAAGLASDGTNRFWLAVCKLNGAQYDLMMIHAGVHTDIFNAVENTGKLKWIEAAYNAATDTLDLVYTIDASDAMYWARYGLDGTPVAGTEISPGDACLTPMLEVDPVTGRPALVYLSTVTDRVYYTELNPDLATWAVPELICDTTQNLVIPGLAFDDGIPLALVGLNDGTYNIFRRDGGWALTNSLPDSGSIFALGTVVDTPGPGGVVTFRTSGSGLISFQVAPDGTNSFRWNAPLIGPQGAELHGAAASDGLHVVYRNVSGGLTHFTSLDGTGWTSAMGLASAQNIDVAASRTGELYLSHYNTGAAYLAWWDGAGWVPESSFLTDELHRPFLSSISSNDAVRFGGYLTATSDVTFRNIQHSIPPSVTDLPFSSDLWTACVSPQSSRMICMTGGAQPTSASAQAGQWSNNSLTALYLGGASQIMSSNVFVTGKTIAHAHYHTNYIFGDQDAFWTVSGLGGDPIRSEYGAFSNWETTPIDLGYSGDANDYRRTVTAITTPGWTAVALISPLDKQQPYFEWSNFGDWETLPLPPGVTNMQNPELIVDADGRWHLVYRDWVTDDLLCISTT